MANNWYGGPTPPSDPSTFDYETAAQKVQRQRAAAQALQTLGMQSNRGQLIKNGDFIGYAGGNTLGSTAARIAAAVLGANANDNTDSAQKQLGQDSQSALTWALDPKNTPAGQKAAADQIQSENDAQLQREMGRSTNTIQGGDYVDPQATQQAIPPAQTFPVSAPDGVTPIPMASAVNQAAARALSAQGATKPMVRPTAQATPVTGGPQSFGTGADFSKTLAPPTNLPVGASGPLSANDIAFATKMLGGAPAPIANASGTQQNAPQASSVPASTPAQPLLPAQTPAQPLLPAQQAAAPIPQPSSPTPEDTARSLGVDPTGDPRSMVDQSVAKANANASFGDQMANLQQISRTGPMGQQLAMAQMNNQFGSKVGRYKTTVMADPVNGGFVKVTEDSATGATSTDRIGSPNGTLVTGQTTDANGNRLNVHKDGSTSPMLDASGRPVVDSSVTARNDDQTTKIGTAIQSNTTAQAAIDTALARNQRILQLYTETETGPLMGHLPNVTAKRQELQALLAQDLFGETRNALAGAGDAGGAPKMAQSEFKYMRDNGGLSQTTNATTAANIIASMNTQLNAQKQALQGYAQTLKTTAPGAVAPSGVPGRGQTVNAGQWGFK